MAACLPDLSASPPLWETFDGGWFRARYRPGLSPSEAQESDEGLQAAWQREPARSPNRYFDEEWYLRRYPNVRREVGKDRIFESGFQHYREVGYQRCAPHWLFSEADYWGRNPDLVPLQLAKEGWRNGYDHFLKLGDFQERSGHAFFSPQIFLQDCLKHGVTIDLEQGLFTQFLAWPSQEEAGGKAGAELSQRRTSWYFNPQWYLERYPEVAQLIAEGRYHSPLHHYLTNETPAAFDPDPDFSEKWYLETFPDVQEAIFQGAFRNGFAHFLQAGVREGRPPCPAVDLQAFIQQPSFPARLARSGLADAFALWVREREEGSVPDTRVEISPAAAQALAVRQAEVLMPTVARSPLVFRDWSPSHGARPALSVIVLSQGDYLSTVASLAALKEQDLRNVQVIVASAGNRAEKEVLAATTRGVTLVYPPVGGVHSPLGLIKAGTEQALSDNLVLLQAGYRFFPDALAPVFRALERGESGGGRVLGPDLQVLEAGASLWRDGHITPRNRETLPEEELTLPGTVDLFCQGVMFAPKARLSQALERVGQVRADEYPFPVLSAALAESGQALSYVADGVVQAMVPPPENLPAEASEAIRAHFPLFLSRQPLQPAARDSSPPTGAHHPHARKQRSMLILCEQLPQSLKGGSSRKLLRRLRLLQADGWAVEVAGLNPVTGQGLAKALDFPGNVRLHDGIGSVHDFLQSRKDVSLVWFCGTAALERTAPALQALGLEARCVLETENLKGQGLQAMEDYLRRRVGLQDDRARLAVETRAELHNAWLCQAVVCSDREQTTLLQQLGYDAFQLEDVPSETEVSPAQPVGWEPRDGLLFALPVHEAGDAGHDALNWFCLEVLPHLQKVLGREVPVYIGSYRNPTVALEDYGRFGAITGLQGSALPEELLKRCRVVIAPGRVVSAQVGELVEAASAGVPIVTTPQLAQRMGWEAERECKIGSQDEGADFARKILALYQDEREWQALSAGARRWARDRQASQTVTRQLETVLATVMEQKPSPRCALAVTPSPAERAFAPAPLRLGKKQPSAPAESQALAAELPGEQEEEIEEEVEIIPPRRLGVSLAEGWQNGRAAGKKKPS
ncbi:glycosyltransferase [Oecophyllibacter saccharovorans]|uniref:glycosyltransferase n=1 Tax=Oecophyllibacter saccharovorans TaxID=2558360 RepID=UPI00114250E5|nr:glycosyltransferase [Oecophyllibacter saccharovorans]QDH15835.1 glycosyltransferase [Oecophyllibacter saccharovorans]